MNKERLFKTEYKEFNPNDKLFGIDDWYSVASLFGYWKHTNLKKIKRIKVTIEVYGVDEE